MLQVLSRGGEAVEMTTDHKPNTERGSIENRGGFVSNMPGSSTNPEFYALLLLIFSANFCVFIHHSFYYRNLSFVCCDISLLNFFYYRAVFLREYFYFYPPSQNNNLCCLSNCKINQFCP
ncbi:hypothetical protein S245_048906 [Arachis hypogaea]